MVSVQDRTLSRVAFICLICLFSLFLIQAAGTYALYQNALNFQKTYIQHTVDNILLSIDATRNEIITTHKKKGQPISEQEVQEVVENLLRKTFYSATNTDGTYIWINEVIDYDGGNGYARRLIHPNLRNTEGILLSTETPDAKGNYPYRTELEGVCSQNSLFYSYYFKDLNSNELSQKLTYARLYPDYNWIICMGIPYHSIWEYIFAGKPWLKWLILFSYLFSISGIIFTSFYLYRLYRRQRQSQNEEIKDLQLVIDHDALTNAHSRHYGTQQLKQALQTYQETNQNITLVMFDIDYFKKVNDTMGHDFGDKVLTDTVKIISQNIRQHDSLIRWGGDEFILLLPSLSQKALPSYLHRLNACIQEHAFVSTDKQSMTVSISIGAAQFLPDDASIDTLIKRADKALYKAKEIRNTYHIDEESFH
ncbi:diguanylate cyclase (GGDEF) domain-containing protein [Selenomonas sp. WCT3]|nr:diguanylate cyclase (GGDEF) domain-containing protein [Selenomonas ruminantium]